METLCIWGAYQLLLLPLRNSGFVFGDRAKNCLLMLEDPQIQEFRDIQPKESLVMVLNIDFNLHICSPQILFLSFMVSENFDSLGFCGQTSPIFIVSPSTTSILNCSFFLLHVLPLMFALCLPDFKTKFPSLVVPFLVIMRLCILKFLVMTVWCQFG